MDDRKISDTSRANGTGAKGSNSIDPDAPASSPGATDGDSMTGSLRPAFLSELARAMHAAAQQERERIAGVIDEDANAHVEKVRSRAALETEELRRLADEDVTRIEEWSASEIKRIRAEATQRTAERRASLAQYLEQHEAIIGAEIAAVEAAVREYGSTLDAFFAELTETGDPSDIVRRAEQLPAPPDLDAIRAGARADAVARFAGAGEEDVAATGAAEPEVTAEPIDATAEMTAEPAEGVAEAAEGVAEGVAEAAEGVAEAPAEPIEATATEAVEPTTAPPVAADAVTAEAVPDETVPRSESEPAASWSDEAPVMAGGDVDPVNGSSAPADADPNATTEPARAEASATGGNGWDMGEARESESRPAVGVMDASSSSERTGWETEEPVSVGATVDHTSAAVRLLRSVAPWTAPTHDADQRRDGDRG